MAQRLVTLRLVGEKRLRTHISISVNLLIIDFSLIKVSRFQLELT